MKIGFIGTGAMGRPMLANLVKQGHAVSAYDVAEAALDGAVRAGAARAASAAAAARDAELVITILPSSSAAEPVDRAPGGGAWPGDRAPPRPGGLRPPRRPTGDHHPALVVARRVGVPRRWRGPRVGRPRPPVR